MNRPILVTVTGTPTARAASASPPTAKIQLPNRVRSSTQVAIATNTSHHTMVILTSTPPSVRCEAKTFRAESKPSMSLMDLRGDRAADQLGDGEVEAGAASGTCPA